MSKPQPAKIEAVSKSNLARIETLARQLDLVKHISESGFWLTTEELCLLLDLDGSALTVLNGQPLASSFTWRNFTCNQVNRQQNSQFWSITLTNLQNSAIASPLIVEPIVEPSPPVIQPNFTQTHGFSTESLKATDTSESGVLPSYYAQIENFLPASQLEALFKYVLEQEANFTPTSNSANDPYYRRSMFLSVFPQFSQLMSDRIQSIVPYIITYLGLPNFKVELIETQLTTHNDGNYYKIHNDNGSPDSANRELTYVYYFHREPKPFSGGELLIYDSKVENNFYVAAKSFKTVQPKNNSIVFFLSRYMHEVLPVSCPSRAFRDSRFTINGWVRRSAA